MEPFNAEDAVASSELAIDAAVGRLMRQLRWEASEAVRCAKEYAEHLAAGGDPNVVPRANEPDDEALRGSTMISTVSTLIEIFGDWNRARTRPNPFSPFNGKKSFLICEYAMTRIGEPMTYGSLVEVATAAGGGKVDSNDVARALASMQGDDLVLRRTKVLGKVAYLLRERREGEEFVGNPRTGNRPVHVWASDVPEEKAVVTA